MPAPTREQIYDSFLQADKAGDTETAQQLADYIRTMDADERTRPQATVDVSNLSPAEKGEFERTGQVPQPLAESFGPIPGEAVSRRMLQGATSGYSDEIAGGMSALGAKITGDERPIGDIYADERDTLRGRNDMAREQAGVGYELAGGLMSPNPFTKLKTVGTLGKAALTGAAAGLGYSEADTVGGQAFDTGVGALVGAGADKLVRAAPGAAKAVGGYVADKLRQVPGAPAVEKFAREAGTVVSDYAEGLGGGISRAVQRATSPEGLSRTSKIQAARAAGLQGIADTNRIGGIEAAEEAGDFLLRTGIVNPKRLDRASIQEEAERQLAAAGEQIGKVREAMREAGVGPETEELVEGIARVQGQLGKYRDLPQVAGLIKIGDDVVAALRTNTDRYGTTPPQVLDEMKGMLDDELFKLGDTGNLQGRLSQPAQQMRAGIRELFKAEEERIADQLHETIGKQFREAKSAYGNLKDVLYLAGRGDKRDISNKAISLTDWTLLGPAASSGPEGIVAGTLAYGAKQVGEKFGNASTALAARSPATRAAIDAVPAAAKAVGNATSSVWSKALGEASARGPRALQVTAAALIRRHPEDRWKIADELERLRQEMGEFEGEGDTPGVSATMVPPTPSDERVKESVRPVDSKQLLRRYVQVQAGKRPSAAAPTPERGRADSAPPPEKRREAYAMHHEGGKLRSIEGAKRRITIVRDEQGLPISMELEDL